MVAAAVTENKTANVDVYDPNVELVQFTTAASGDYYLCRKLKNVDAAFASQATANNKEIHISWANESNGQPKITLVTGTSGTVTGWLTIYGRP